jgi:uncharacterized protein
MFKGNDKSYLLRPQFMSFQVMEQTIFRIRRYIKKYNIPALEIILHGGEPLLIGIKKLSFFIKELNKLSGICKLNINIQSNGTLLTEEIVSLLLKYDVHIGISLDGYPEIQNKTKTKTGSESYDIITKSVRLIQKKAPSLFGGILSVIDLNSDPRRIYRHFRFDLNIYRMDFLLPLRNAASKLNYDPFSLYYYKWLKVLFDEYFNEDNDKVEIRLFDSIIDLLLKNDAPMCTLRHSAIDILTIETNGNIELVDDLRVCGYDFTNININVEKNEIDEFFNTERVKEMIDAEKNLPSPCVKCKYLSICGSGGHAFRYGADSTFNHPSIYCHDTIAFVNHIERKIFSREEIDSFYLKNSIASNKFYSDTLKVLNIEKTNGFDESPELTYQYFEEFIPVGKINVIDLGCGNGLLLNYLMEKQFKLIPHGIDFRKEAIDEAIKYIHQDSASNFSVCNISDYDFDNSSFDLIFLDPFHVHDDERMAIVTRALASVNSNGFLILFSYYDALRLKNINWVKEYKGLEHLKINKYKTVEGVISICAISRDSNS